MGGARQFGLSFVRQEVATLPDRRLSGREREESQGLGKTFPSPPLGFFSLFPFQGHIGKGERLSRGAGGGKEEGGMPNQQRTPNINFLVSSNEENFVNKHQLSIQIGTKRAKNVYAICMFCN